MTSLLDKLSARSSVAKCDSPPATILPDDDFRSKLSESPVDSDAAWLADTRACDSNSPKTMKFTYSPGSKPLDRYTIRRGIGVGGFGEVYFALTEAGKEVALKRIQRNLEVELRGAQHCLNLKHPNLVSLYDICRDDQDQWWVVMEYIAGKNLREILDDSPQGLPTAEAERWFTAIAAGVAHLHSAGLVHRDLKPGNVFDDLGIVKVGDYGLSKFISASHRGGHTESVGTFHYMAPEIGRGRYGREIDIYAMGVVLYELLTGRVPFDGESCHEIIVKHMTAVPDLAGIDQPYRATIEKCLQKDPARRFSTIQEMLDSLGGAPATGSVESKPIQATLVTDVEESLGKHSPEQPFAPESAAAEPILAAMAVVPDPPPSEEPLARAVGQSLDDLKRWWRSLDRSPGAKFLLGIAFAFVLLINTHWLLPLMSVLGMVYVPYYIVRQMVLHVRQQPSYAQAQAASLAAVAPGDSSRRGMAGPRVMTKSHWRAQTRNSLRAKHSIHRIAELNTSWIAAILTVTGLTVVAGVIGMRTGAVDAMTLAPYGWMFSTVLLASLALLGLGKLWERDEGEGLPRRLVLAGVGAGVGAAAFAMKEFLMLPVDVGLARDVDATTLPQALYDGRGVPLASAMMAHFALLLAAMRWWKPVDPLRSKRLAMWPIAVAVVMEWAVHQVLPIPQPAGYLVAGGIAITIQMASPWINPRQMPAVNPERSSANPLAADSSKLDSSKHGSLA